MSPMLIYILSVLLCQKLFSCFTDSNTLMYYFVILELGSLASFHFLLPWYLTLCLFHFEVCFFSMHLKIRQHVEIDIIHRSVSFPLLWQNIQKTIHKNRISRLNLFVRQLERAWRRLEEMYMMWIWLMKGRVKG